MDGAVGPGALPVVNTSSPETSQGEAEFTVKQGATAIHEDSAVYTVSASCLTMEVEAVTHALRWTASKIDRLHMPSSSQIQ